MDTQHVSPIGSLCHRGVLVCGRDVLCTVGVGWDDVSTQRIETKCPNGPFELVFMEFRSRLITTPIEKYTGRALVGLV